ncbi:MAG: NAD(P)-binding domain-containing protein [Acidimicrobiales bacterium]|nr:NAD(P)-binding domain-containing protein [Acidimicrobiales bacterium]
MARHHVHVAPDSGRVDSLQQAALAGGAELVDASSAEVLIWADPARAGELADYLETMDKVTWVALPYAGIEPYLPTIRSRRDLLWTCARDVYSRPVAEHAVALATSGLRNIVGYARQDRWTAPAGTMLTDGRITIFGGGGISRALISLLQGWNCDITVVRRSAEPLAGAARVMPPSKAVEAVRGADAVVLALPLTEHTRHIIDKTVLRAMEPHAWIVNVARGGVIDTDDLVEALVEGSIGGAALDVTDPEPLPDGHQLWDLSNVVITPHVGNTPEMGIPLLAAFIEENVRSWIDDNEVEGVVDPESGY